MARLARVVVSVALALAVPPAPVGARQQPTFASGVDLATFGVTAVDRKGQLVTTLTADDFEVFEDGVRQQVRHFVRGEGGAAVPLHLGLLLDTSGSMERDLKLARSAAIKFLNTLPEAADMTLVDFDTEVRAATFGQRDFARLVERIRNRRPEGMTALYDALAVYLDAADEQDGRQVLVVYTDGGDTRSTIGYGELLDLLKASRTTVYAVGLIEHQGSAQAEQRMRLTQMAEQTGGLAFFPSKLEDLEASYAKVVDDIHAQYQLGFLSTNAATDGTWRKVEIRTTTKGVKLRSRKGYFAPYRE
jgi:Ca-activated chloride channel family protein